MCARLCPALIRIHSLIIELEDVVHIPSDNAPTLSLLDSALKRFISLCASYHGELAAVSFVYVLIVDMSVEQYLQSPFQLEHACELLLSSELFAFHSERMCEILTDEAQSASASPCHRTFQL